jgi:hypothetical protein
MKDLIGKVLEYNGQKYCIINHVPPQIESVTGRGLDKNGYVVTVKIPLSEAEFID